MSQRELLVGQSSSVGLEQAAVVREVSVLPVFALQLNHQLFLVLEPVVF